MDREGHGRLVSTFSKGLLENSASKMNFYPSPVADCHCHPDDPPSNGVFPCKTGNRVITAYTMTDDSLPLGVSRYVAHPVRPLPNDLKGVLPSSRQIAGKLEVRPRR
jgi:hypothetical protein